MTNTPPTFAWYVADLVFEWLQGAGRTRRDGGHQSSAKRTSFTTRLTRRRSFRNPVALECRSWMNVPFILADASLDARFLEESHAAGLTNLKGHRSVGGMRASIYNAVPEAAIDTLIEFMSEFERNV